MTEIQQWESALTELSLTIRATKTQVLSDRDRDDALNIIARLRSQPVQLEMFARRERDGWETWGNDVAKNRAVRPPESSG